MRLSFKREEKTKKRLFPNYLLLRYDSHTIKISVFKVYHYDFRNIQKVVQPSLPSNSRKFSLPPNKCCISQTLHPIHPSPQPLELLTYFVSGFAYYGYFIIMESCSMPSFVFGFFIYHNVLKIHTYCSTCWYYVHLYDWIIFHHMDISHFVYSVDNYLCYVTFWLL